MSSAQKSNEEVIFNTARKIDSDEARQEYLTQVCAGDAALMERVENLLKSQADESQFLEVPAVELTQARGEVREQPGEQIGRYKLLQRIGEGGFGVVYMAEQEKPVRRKVALKVIKAGMDTREVVARFEAERQALALMEHPNIAKVLDGGSTESGRPYFVMELVKGVPLTKFCDENKLDTSKRLELFQTVCKAIQHAHQKGIIHRDIKPSNVMVTLHDGEPVVKVIDFGVSKAISQQLTEKTLFTAYGQMIGTPQYMSPEQAEMSGLDIDTRSDIYSLGVLLYELLTGSTPIQPERLRETGFAEMQRLIREEEPPRPSMRLSTLGEQTAKVAIARGSEPKKLGDLLRGEIDWIVMKAIEKNRDRRYETATGLSNDVQRYLEGDPVSACPPSIAYRFKKFANKNRGVLASVGSVMAVLILATIVSTIFAFRANRAEAVANRNLGELREEQRKNVEAYAQLSKERGEEALKNAFDQFLRGNVEESRKSLDVAREHDANPAEIALYEAVLVHYGDSNTKSEQLKEQLDVVLKHMPDSMSANALLASENQWGASRNMEKVKELEKLLVLQEPKTSADYLLAAQFFAFRDPDRAIKYLEMLLKTHNSRLVYYELARVYDEGIAHRSYKLADIRKALKFAEVAYTTMPGNVLACRRYVRLHLIAAGYYRLHENEKLELEHISLAESAADVLVKNHRESAKAHQVKSFVHTYKGEWDQAIDHSLQANKYTESIDDWADAAPLLLLQGRDPLESSGALLENQPRWRPLLSVHTQGPEKALELFQEWESKTKNQNPFAALAIFETFCILGRPDEAFLAARRQIERSGPPDNISSSDFRDHVLEFVAGELEIGELESKAKTRFDRIDVHFLEGCLRLGEGKREKAIQAFEEMEREGTVIRSGGRWLRATAYLHRLREDPNWPSWIPTAESE